MYIILCAFSVLRHVLFHPSGQYLFACSQTSVRMLGWEPTRTFGLITVAQEVGTVANISCPIATTDDEKLAKMFRLDSVNDGQSLALRCISFENFEQNHNLFAGNLNDMQNDVENIDLMTT